MPLGEVCRVVGTSNVVGSEQVHQPRRAGAFATEQTLVQRREQGAGQLRVAAGFELFFGAGVDHRLALGERVAGDPGLRALVEQTAVTDNSLTATR